MSMIEDIQNGKYQTNMEYPTHKGKTASMMNFNEREEAKNQYTKEKEAYDKEMKRIEDLFWEDFGKEFEISDHPKFEQLKSIAWEYGHAFGYAEVYKYAEDLVNLIK